MQKNDAVMVSGARKSSLEFVARRRGLCLDSPHHRVDVSVRSWIAVEDIEKIKHYCDLEIQHLEEKKLDMGIWGDKKK